MSAQWFEQSCGFVGCDWRARVEGYEHQTAAITEAMRVEYVEHIRDEHITWPTPSLSEDDNTR